MGKNRFAGFAALILAAVLFLFFSFPRGMSLKAEEKTGHAPVYHGSAETGPAAASKGEAPAGNESVTVEIPLEKQKRVRIGTVAASVKSMKKMLRTVGRVEIDERKLTTVNTRVEGWIETLYADYAGKYVTKGEPLAEIYSPELMSLQLEYLNLLKWRGDLGFRSSRNVELSWGDRYGTVGRLNTNDPQALYEVARQKFSLWEIPEEQVLEIERTRKPIKTMTLKSPAEGVVFQKSVFKGTRITPGEKLFDIVDLSTVWVLADIYEYEIPFVKAGQNAKITLSYYPEKEILAKVDFVYPSLSSQTRTAKVRFVIPNPGGLLKPQMFANVAIEIDLGKRLAVPENAVLDTGTRQVVYVDLGEGRFALREVKVGIRGGGAAEILRGIKAGEKVASSAVFLIDSESKLSGAAQ